MVVWRFWKKIVRMHSPEGAYQKNINTLAAMVEIENTVF